MGCATVQRKSEPGLEKKTGLSLRVGKEMIPPPLHSAILRWGLTQGSRVTRGVVNPAPKAISEEALSARILEQQGRSVSWS